MMTTEQVQAWLDGYVAAWGANDAAAIGALFAPDVQYYFTPYTPVVTGRDAVVAEWMENPDPPDTWQASYSPVLVTGNQTVANGRSTYFNEDGSFRAEWNNLFLLTFNDAGECTEYREWYMKKPE